jgi:hypothetical protein
LDQEAFSTWLVDQESKLRFMRQPKICLKDKKEKECRAALHKMGITLAA